MAACGQAIPLNSGYGVQCALGTIAEVFYFIFVGLEFSARNAAWDSCIPWQGLHSIRVWDSSIALQALMHTRLSSNPHALCLEIVGNSKHSATVSTIMACNPTQ